MSLRTRLALAFALVAAVVAGLVGVLSHRAASERITDETDRSLSSATTALLEGQTAVLSALPPSAPTDRDGLDGNGPDRPDPRGEGPAFVAHQIAPDGTVTFLGGRPVRLPVDPATRALAAYGRTGQVATQEIELGRGAYRVRTTALGDGHGAVQVGLDIDQSRRVLGGLATEIAIISAVVTVVAAGAGWLLARRITRRLVRLASTAEDIADHGRIEVDVPVEGRDEVGRLAGSFTTMFARLAAARDAQDRLVQDAAHELRTPLTSLRTNASVLRRFDELPPEARARLVADVQGETRELSHLVDELVELALSRRGEEPEEDVAPPHADDDVVGAVGVELDRVLEQVAHRALESPAAPADPGPVVVHRDAATAAPVHAGGGTRRHLPEPARRRSPTRAPGSPPATPPGCSTASTAPTRRARCRAPASGSRSCATWPRATEAAPSPPPRPAAARP